MDAFIVCEDQVVLTALTAYLQFLGISQISTLESATNTPLITLVQQTLHTPSIDYIKKLRQAFPQTSITLISPLASNEAFCEAAQEAGAALVLSERTGAAAGFLPSNMEAWSQIETQRPSWETHTSGNSRPNAGQSSVSELPQWASNTKNSSADPSLRATAVPKAMEQVSAEFAASSMGNNLHKEESPAQSVLQPDWPREKPAWMPWPADESEKLAGQDPQWQSLVSVLGQVMQATRTKENNSKVVNRRMASRTTKDAEDQQVAARARGLTAQMSSSWLSDQPAAPESSGSSGMFKFVDQNPVATGTRQTRKRSRFHAAKHADVAPLTKLPDQAEVSCDADGEPVPLATEQDDLTPSTMLSNQNMNHRVIPEVKCVHQAILKDDLVICILCGKSRFVRQEQLSSEDCCGGVVIQPEVPVSFRLQL